MADGPDASPGMRGPTLDDIVAAVQKLKAANIDPIECPRCGNEFYLFIPPGCSLPLKGPILCEDCDPRHHPRP